MNIGIFYFSGTGTTAKLASEILKSFKNRGNKGKLIRLTAKLLDSKFNFDISELDILGFGAPVYSMSAPRLAIKIIKSLYTEISDETAFFVFTTAHGFLGVGNTCWDLYKYPARRTNRYLGKIKAYGTNNIRWWRPKCNKKKPQNDGLNTFHLAKVERFVERILNNYKNQNYKKEHRNVFWSLWSFLLTARWEMWIFLGKKYANRDRCNKCGVCAEEICPSGAIGLDEERYPVFDESKCVACNGCVNLCPQLAINSKLTKKRYPYTTYREQIIRR